MTGLAVHAAALSTPEFVGWTRLRGVQIPFPLNTGELPYIDCPDARSMEQLLATRELDESRALAAAAKALAAPRLTVYAVRVPVDGPEQRIVAVSGEHNDSVLVVLDEHHVAVRQIGDTELAASVAGAIPAMTALAIRPAEITLRELQEIDDAITAGRPARAVRDIMDRAGYPLPLAAIRERLGTDPVLLGLIGAVAGTGPQARHAPRSASWQEYLEGGLLMIEQRRRRGEPAALLTPATPDALFRAAAETASSLHEGAI